MGEEKKYNIKKEQLPTVGCLSAKKDFLAAKLQMEQRTYHHELYGLIAKNKSIHEFASPKNRGKYFSEGSAQYIERKIISETIQRCPDGELVTPYDTLSEEQILLEYIFHNKVMWSEVEGIDMMSNFVNTFKMSFVYAFAPVRIGLAKDVDDDVMVTYNLENWADVFVNPDCKDIRNPEVVYFRQYMSKAEVMNLLDENGNVKDKTYKEETIKYILDHNLFSGRQWESEKLADRLKGATSTESIELVTEYRKGAKEFTTVAIGIPAVFRVTPNYDDRKGIPWSFFVIEPDPDFPIGISQIEYLLSDQQFNDLFQTSAYKNLLLAMEPPIMVAGWETNPSSYKFEPRKIWNLGNNPNQVRVEPVPVNNAVLSSWAATREAISSSMLRSLNVMDGTIATDAGVNFSKTEKGVEEQQRSKTIQTNQYQKRLENFIASWATKALKMYINAMHGTHMLTVDEDTRRRLQDIDALPNVAPGAKIPVDFTKLAAGELEFKVREGSTMKVQEDQERDALLELVQPFIQNLGSWSDENRAIIEGSILMPAVARIMELSGTDLAKTMSSGVIEQLVQQQTQQMNQRMDGMQAQMDGQAQQMQEMQAAQQTAPGAPDEEGGVTPEEYQAFASRFI